MDDFEMLSDEFVLSEEIGLWKEAAVIGGITEDLKTKRAREQGLLTSFKKSPSKDTFMPLYTSFKPLIMKAAQKNMFGSPIPAAAHVFNAANNFMKAAQRHDAAKGPFTTYMYSTVFEGGKRLNLKYQNIGYIPESRATKYQTFQTSNYLLREQLGREPSTHELADEMSMPPAEVERLRKEIRQDLILNEALPNVGPAFAQSDKAMQVARDIQYSLIPKHKVVLEHALGLNGIQALTKKSGGPDVQAIAKKCKLTVAEVRSALKTISRKFKEHRGAIGDMTELDHMIDNHFGGNGNGEME